MKRIVWSFGLFLLTALATAEPQQKTLAVTQTVAAYTFSGSPRSVTVVSDGSDTCSFRLFRNDESAGDATTADPSLSLKSGESLRFVFNPPYSSATYSPWAGSGYYKSISAICPTGKTASFRIYFE